MAITRGTRQAGWAKAKQARGAGLLLSLLLLRFLEGSYLSPSDICLHTSPGLDSL